MEPARNWELIYTRFGDRLRHLLRTEGLTESAFAQSIGRKKGIAYYEKNPGTLPFTSMIFAIRKRYPHWSLDYILLDEGPPILPKDTLPKDSQETSPSTEGYAATIQYWINLRSELSTHLDTLPIEGFIPLYTTLRARLGHLQEGNRDLWEQLGELITSQEA